MAETAGPTGSSRGSASEEPDVPEAIYQRPDDYDLEHVGDTEDVDFYVGLVARLRPRRVLELACGNGRVALPLAEAGVRSGFDVVGLELVPEMLAAAAERREQAPPPVRARLSLQQGDMRTWRPEPGEPAFDVIVTPCSSVCHLLTLDDQLAAWRAAHDNLAPGGRFVVDVAAPDLGAYAESLRSPPREVVEVDRDTFDAASSTRLIRYKTTRYLAHEQRARVRFLYDKFAGGALAAERSVSDFESHVYYPRELYLLYRHAGFTVEAVWGDYRGRPPRPESPQMIFAGRKPE
jgi:SAM-dependent methyltransferase